MLNQGPKELARLTKATLLLPPLLGAGCSTQQPPRCPHARQEEELRKLPELLDPSRWLVCRSKVQNHSDKGENLISDQDVLGNISERRLTPGRPCSERRKERVSRLFGSRSLQ